MKNQSKLLMKAQIQQINPNLGKILIIKIKITIIIKIITKEEEAKKVKTILTRVEFKNINKELGI